jgi:acyl carrier protein
MSVQQEIKRFILSNYLFSTDESALDVTASLMQNGVVDSTGILELIMHVETTYDIKVLDEEMIPANLDSVEAIAGFIERKRGH